MADISITWNNETQIVPLRPGRFRIGRATDNEVCIDDVRVSKRHLEFWIADEVLAWDVGSKNGSEVNGVPLVRQHRVSEGDELLLGGAVQVRVVGPLGDFNAGDSVVSTTLSPSVAEALEAVQREASPEVVSVVREAMWELAEDRAARAWASARLGHLAAAPSPQARLKYLVAEARRLTSAPEIWALSWTPSSGDEVSFDALHFDGSTDDVPSPQDFSASIVAHAGECALWLDDARDNEQLRESESVLALRLRSVGCIPLGPTSVLYLSDPRDRGVFDMPVRRRLEALCELARQLDSRAVDLDDETGVGSELLPGIVGRSQVMRDMADHVAAFRRFTFNTLILGEPGTGKSELARAIHLSAAPAAPFVECNCAELPPALAEATLFGVVKGAFTGATEDRPGWFGEAEGGTLFLDEVGELPVDLQPKLLKVLRKGIYRRVGDAKARTFNGRVIAATNQPIDDPGSTFRRDLFARLNQMRVKVPPLRDRREDVPLIAARLLERLCEDNDPSVGSLTLAPSAVAMLCASDLHDNVAGLDNLVLRGMVQAVYEGSREIRAEHLLEDGHMTSATPDDDDPYDAAKTRFEMPFFQQALERNNENVSATAEDLKMTRGRLMNYLKRLGLR